MTTPRSTLPALLALTTLLAACQTTPSPGSETRAQVTERPASRDALRGGYLFLQPALQAGVDRATVEAGRLVRGECAEPDPSAPQGRRWIGVTALLPAGVQAAPRSLIDVDAPGQTGRLRHAVWRAAGPALDARTGFPTDAVGDRLAVWCRAAPDAPASRLRLRVSGPVSAWEHDFAVAERARLARFSDADFAAGRVAVLRCQLKVIDGGDWYQPVWLARVPDGLALRVDDVVRLRAGATEGSKDTGPEPQVIARLDGERAPAGLAVVNCR